jgi:hypothetical protein
MLEFTPFVSVFLRVRKMVVINTSNESTKIFELDIFLNNVIKFTITNGVTDAGMAA